MKAIDFLTKYAPGDIQQVDTVERDGVKIPMHSADEEDAFNAWLKKNGDKDPYHPEQHYDLVSAFREGIDRTKDGEFATMQEGGHLPDKFKLPGHETFSNESMYYKEGMKAGKWEGDKYVPIGGKADEFLNSFQQQDLISGSVGQKAGIDTRQGAK